MLMRSKGGLPLPPSEFVEAIVVDAEVVGNLVHDGGNDFVHDVFVGVADSADCLSINEDAIRKFADAVCLTFGERNAVVEPKHVGMVSVVFDQKDHIVDQPKQVVGDEIDGLADQHFKTFL